MVSLNSKPHKPRPEALKGHSNETLMRDRLARSNGQRRRRGLAKQQQDVKGLVLVTCRVKGTKHVLVSMQLIL